jgi:cytochrome bd-type quinol oxidase subunit 1
MKQIINSVKTEPFLKTSVMWGLGLLCMIMVAKFGMLQLTKSYDRAIDEIIPFFTVLFGAAYLVRFIGSHPVFYTAVCGATVGVGMGFLGLVNDLMAGFSLNAFVRFFLVALIRAIPLFFVGALAGWIMTRGRTPIAIEMPTKKEEEKAKQEGRDVGPRIVTPVNAMPGSAEANQKLLDKLESDPLSLMSDKEREKYLKRAQKAKAPQPAGRRK